MKRFLLRLVVAICAVVCIDGVFGTVMDAVYPSTGSEAVEDISQVCFGPANDIVIMGSSRARHHYISRMMEDSLNVKCYNTGKNGNGIVLMSGIYELLSDNYKPKLIIYDVSRFDYFHVPEDKENSRYLAPLKPYAHNDGIRKLIKEVSFEEWIKSFSGLCRYNSVFWGVVKRCIWGAEKDKDKGYAVAKEVFKGARGEEKAEREDEVKVRCLRHFIEQLRQDGVPIVFVVSPLYDWGKEPLIAEPIRKISEEYHIPFWDYSSFREIAEDRTMFADWIHMNENGAQRFTQQVIETVRRDFDLSGQ